MQIPIDRQSKIPLYRQIEEWLRHNIYTGNLPGETRLPATRALASELGVSRITVKNAYAGLESDGLILTHEGSGTFVASPLPGQQRTDSKPQPDWPLWQIEAASPINISAKDFTQPDPPPGLISFTGVGDPREFHISEFARTLQHILRRDGTVALDYGPFDNGFLPLRQTVVHILAHQGIQANPDEILITNGSQQALALVCEVLLKPGDRVLVESPTYNLALELFTTFGLKIIPIPIDEIGLQGETLEPILQQYHPRLIYTIPNFQNPSGVCLSGVRRRQLLYLAERYNIPILEDDFVGDLRYEGRAQPAIKALDTGGHTIYVGTFSKMLMPGLRVGYLLANGPVFDRLVHQKRVQDLTTVPLMQRALDQYVTIGRYQAHLQRSIRRYRARRDKMMSALQRYLPEISVSPVQGGLFLWGKLPEGISSQDLLPLAFEAGVMFTPGIHFFPNSSDGDGFLRLNFSSSTEDEIETGIKRLSTAFQKVRRFSAIS